MTEHATPSRSRFSLRDGLMLGGGVLLALLALYLWSAWARGKDTSTEEAQEPQAISREPSNQLTIPHDVITAAGIETVPVGAQPASERLQATGIVEPDQRQIQDVTPLIAGRVEQVNVTLGEFVRSGATLLTVSSPQIAELQGALRTAEAKLVEAESTLNRAKRLVELGAGAGKDLIAAETEFRAMQALVTQTQQSLRALGGNAANESDSANGGTSFVAILAPMSGQVITRTVNPGAWIEAGKSVLTIANLGTVWIIANVPQARLNMIRAGAPVEIRAPTLGPVPLAGHVNYVDPQLDQETRTAKVRVEVPNSAQALKIGMFVDVVVQGLSHQGASELIVPEIAVQRIGERSVVFVATDNPERFEIRDVELGDEVGESRVVRSGLASNDRVVTKGGFTLKSQLLKGQFGEDEDIGTKAK